MTTWLQTGTVSRLRTTQIAVRLVDDLTTKRPIGPLQITLEEEGAPNEWLPSGRRPTINASGIVTFPGLEERRNGASLPPRKYRVLVRADYYRPLYAPGVLGLEVMVQPFDEASTLPALPAATPLLLMPGPTYPFPSHIRVLRGRVRLLGTTDYVAGAVVRQGMIESTLADEQGAYALALRWAPLTGPLTIDADDRAGKAGNISITLPVDLAVSNTIDIS